MLRYPYDRLPLSRYREKCLSSWYPLNDDEFEYGGRPPSNIDISNTQYTGNRGQEARAIREEIARGSVSFVSLNNSIFTFRNGESQNRFLPDVKQRFETFGRKLMDWYERKVIVSSGYRSPAHNASVGGAPNSWHTTGAGMDISAGRTTRNGQVVDERYEIADLAVGHGFGGVAVGRSFVHIDCGPYGRWSYNGMPLYKGPSTSDRQNFRRER